MNCLRCNTEMRHYALNSQINVYGAWYKPSPLFAERSEPHHINSVYICDNCGYSELSTKHCYEPDV